MLKLTIDESDKLVLVAHALSSDIRINILKLLHDRSLMIAELAQELDLPVSTAAANVRVLEQAGLISTRLQPATRGMMKLCTRNYGDIYMDLNKDAGFEAPNNVYEMEMPVGHYMSCEVYPTCGLMSHNGLFQPTDEPNMFLHPDRMTAQLLWFRRGYVEYVFPVLLPDNAGIQSIQFSMELCSEAPGYNHQWPSDITLWIADREIGTWTSPGDFGDRKGRYNPAWMPTNHTQYGLLKTWKVEAAGTYLDDVKLSDTRLADLGLEANLKKIRLRIGIKEQAEHVGGINLFGKDFGDYNQSIVMRIIYE